MFIVVKHIWDLIPSKCVGDFITLPCPKRMCIPPNQIFLQGQRRTKCKPNSSLRSVKRRCMHCYVDAPSLLLKRAEGQLNSPHAIRMNLSEQEIRERISCFGLFVGMFLVIHSLIQITSLQQYAHYIHEMVLNIDSLGS